MCRAKCLVVYGDGIQNYVTSFKNLFSHTQYIKKVNNFVAVVLMMFALKL